MWVRQFSQYRDRGRGSIDDAECEPARQLHENQAELGEAARSENHVNVFN